MIAVVPNPGGHPETSSMDISTAGATIPAMDFDTLKSIIEAHRDELRELGVRRVRVFGSVARGEATEASDVDLIVDMVRDDYTLLDLGGVQYALQEWCGVKVDLSETRSLREADRFRDAIKVDLRDVAEIS